MGMARVRENDAPVLWINKGIDHRDELGRREISQQYTVDPTQNLGR